MIDSDPAPSAHLWGNAPFSLWVCPPQGIDTVCMELDAIISFVFQNVPPLKVVEVWPRTVLKETSTALVHPLITFYSTVAAQRHHCRYQSSPV